jgi:hypothetical protein
VNALVEHLLLTRIRIIAKASEGAVVSCFLVVLPKEIWARTLLTLAKRNTNIFARVYQLISILIMAFYGSPITY